MNLKYISAKLFESKKSKFLDLCKKNGIQLDYDTNRNAWDILKAIFYQREYADYFPFYQKATIIDIGAHYGYFSLFACINSSKGSRIIALEPDSDNFRHLVQNIDNNNFTNIEPIHQAIANQNGQIEFFSANGVNSSLINDYALSKTKAVPVEVHAMTLQHLIEEKSISKIDFLKMDCEGAEYEILSGMTSEVFDKISTISMEFHDMKNAEYTGDTIVNILKNKGFKIVKFKYEPSNYGLNYGKIIGSKI